MGLGLAFFFFVSSFNFIIQPGECIIPMSYYNLNQIVCVYIQCHTMTHPTYTHAKPHVVCVTDRILSFLNIDYILFFI